jgi:hypothetical protein
VNSSGYTCIHCTVRIVQQQLYLMLLWQGACPAGYCYCCCCSCCCFITIQTGRASNNERLSYWHALLLLLLPLLFVVLAYMLQAALSLPAWCVRHQRLRQQTSTQRLARRCGTLGSGPTPCRSLLRVKTHNVHRLYAMRCWSLGPPASCPELYSSAYCPELYRSASCPELQALAMPAVQARSTRAAAALHITTKVLSGSNQCTC